MYVDINGTRYTIGHNLEYSQTNADGAYQDKLKYRLVQQNNMLLQVIQALATDLAELRMIINNLIKVYVWASDSDTAIISDDNTILTFVSYSTSET